jgi:hypothetical protein
VEQWLARGRSLRSAKDRDAECDVYTTETAAADENAARCAVGRCIAKSILTTHGARSIPARIARVRARRPCGLTMLHNGGIRRLAIAVLQQSVAELQGPIPEFRRCAAAFMARREDFDEFWCALTGLKGDAVRDRLDHQEAA